MTSHYDDDAFELTFENAVSEAHTRAERGNEPSGKTWGTIRRELSANQMRAETADPRALGPDLAVEHSTTERTHSMDAAYAPQFLPGSSANRQRFGWMALMAAGLVGLMIITNLWINGGSPGDDRNDLAWAPGMGTPESSDSTTPIASPPVYIYGPEFACNVEPLTEQQVFDIVMNPEREYLRRSGDQRTKSSDRLDEGQTLWFKSYEQGPMNRDQYVYPDDDKKYAEIENAANTFWNCMMTGSALQMWSLMDPYVVQREILIQYPVLRDEATIRKHIQEWGPRRYSAQLFVSFEDLGNQDPLTAQRFVTDSADAIMITSDRESKEVTSAIVVMQPHPDSRLDRRFDVEMYMRPTPDGGWWVVSLNYPYAFGMG